MGHFGILHLGTYLLGVLVILVLPGPNMLNTISVATRIGWRAGLMAIAGMIMGDLVLLAVTATGAATLLQHHPAFFNGLKYVGAAYLLWLGLKVIYQAIKNIRVKHAAETNEEVLAEVAQMSHKKHFMQSMFVCLLNPKAWFFFLAFFVQFVDPKFSQPDVPFAILGAIFIVLSGVVALIEVFFGAYFLEQFKSHQRVAACASILVGVLFLGFAASLALSGLQSSVVV